jgi:centromeric protein E
VASLEARKAKLAAQLAKLNAEILTSELPRSGSGSLLLSPTRPKRHRLSEFAGVGNGTPKKMIERRAISGMARVVEEHEGSGISERMAIVTSEIEITKVSSHVNNR